MCLDLFNKKEKLIYNILILGFYDRKNFGDDNYKYIFQKLFGKNSKYNINVICSDDCTHIPYNTHLLIIGGGEILNEYFINKISNLLKPYKYKIPVYAISCELSSNEIVYSGKLNFIDYFIVRNLNDANILTSYYGKDNVLYKPDIVFYLNNYFSNITKKYNNKIKTVYFCLARPIYTNNSYYDTYIYNISKFIEYLTLLKINIKLLSFNTSDNINESDDFLNNDILNKLNIKKFNIKKNIKINNNFDNKMENIIKSIDESELVVCSRYHAHIYSILRNKPFMSISHTKKTKDLLIQNDLNELCIYPELDKYNKPININTNDLINKFN